MYAGDLLNNLEQHTNIDHNNDVDNHVIIPFIFIRILLVMQIRIGLIPLITSTFVFYTWELPGNAAIRIFMFLSMKLYILKIRLKKHRLK